VARLKRGVLAEERQLQQKKRLDAHFQKQTRERYLREAASASASASAFASDASEEADGSRAYARLGQYFLASLARSQKYPDVTFELMPGKQKATAAPTADPASRKRKGGPEGRTPPSEKAARGNGREAGRAPPPAHRGKPRPASGLDRALPPPAPR